MRTRRSFVVQPSSGGPAADVNVTPMVDIVLVLLIIFMTVSPLRDAAIRTALPEQGEGPAGEVVQLDVDAAGEFQLGGARVAEGVLVEVLRDALARQRAEAVLVSPAAATPYPAVIRALDAAKRAGAGTFGIAPD